MPRPAAFARTLKDTDVTIPPNVASRSAVARPMARSRWFRFVSVAIGAVAAGLAASAGAASPDDQKLHLATSPADFAALGLGQTVAVREDGRRTTSSADTFEWWYFD